MRADRNLGLAGRTANLPGAAAGLCGQLRRAGGLLFVAFQMVQVVVPVLPGGLGCLVGVVLFGR